MTIRVQRALPTGVTLDRKFAAVDQRLGKIVVTMDKLTRLRRRIRRCRLCGDINAKRRRVPGVDPSSAAIMLVGEAPSRLGGDRTGIPFTDRSGRFLRQALQECGIRPEQVYISNIVKCNPRQGMANRPPSRVEIEDCRRFYLRELELVKPMVVVPLGKIATEAILGRRIRMREVVAKPSCSAGVIVFPLYHPSYVVNRHRYQREAFIRDLEALCDVLSSLSQTGTQPTMSA